VIAQAVKVLEVLRDEGLALVWKEFPYSADYYLSEGWALPEGGLEALGAFDAILVGAFGDPRIPDMAHAKEILLGARRRFDLYVNERPVHLLHERLTPIKGLQRADVNFVIFRENTEGAYVGAGGVFKAGTPDEVALQSALATRKGVERILRRAFERASGLSRKRLHMADKHNALEFIGNLWYRTFLEVAGDFPEVQARHIFVDTLCHDLVQDPAKFEVIVTSNLFGDLISDLGAALVGGLGVAPSANVNPETRRGLFEPVHGSAPDISGKGLANPMATFLSVAMMLDFLGFSPEARRVEEAVQVCAARGEVTRDLGGDLSTGASGDAVCGALRDPGRDGAEWA
jgi:3-isopropylmalate dehydrogenase